MEMNVCGRTMHLALCEGVETVAEKLLLRLVMQQEFSREGRDAHKRRAACKTASYFPVHYQGISHHMTSKHGGENMF